MSHDPNSIRATASKLGVITALGASVGTAVGAAMGNVAVGVAIGAGLGIALGGLLELFARRKRAR